VAPVAKTLVRERTETAEMAGRRRRPPAALTALIVASLTLAFAWAFLSPPFQAPDENSHFGYTQTFAETGDLPGNPLKGAFSTEQTEAGSASNSDQAAAQRTVKMTWDRTAYEKWLRDDAAFPLKNRKDGGGLNPAASNPPLYYVIEAVPYLAVHGSDLFARLLAMRIVSALWLGLTVLGAWLLAGEVFGRDRLLQLVATGLVALAPMMTFVSSSVSPDAMLYATWTFALWLGVRILRRGLTARAAAALFAVAGLAIVVKATSYALLPAAAFVVIVGLRRRGSWAPGYLARVGAAAAGALALTAGAWFVLASALSRPAAAQVSVASTASGGTSPREFFSYVWQFYLPRLPFMSDFPTVAHTIPVYDIWLKGIWGSFGWTEVVFRNRIYLVIAALTIVIVIVAAVELWKTRAGADKAIGAFLAIATLALLGGVHRSEYNLLTAGASNFNQGRYLLPLAGVAGVILALAVRRLAPARRPLAAGAVLGGLLVLQFFSLALVLQRFYA
jgi:4-amino-4-deoxy-L-arabinose transferase-like glycosyltransferase